VKVDKKEWMSVSESIVDRWMCDATRVEKHYVSQNSHVVVKVGSVYFTTNILATTDWLERLCHQSKIPSGSMTQFK